jgi:DNA polymerase I-like protein with 3'-5' exonuclease and polymerase domains
MASRTLHQPGQHDLFKPDSAWEAPSALPIVPSGTRIALDCETNDRGLQQGVGPSWVNRDGWLCGVSWAFRTPLGIQSGYAPARHPDTSGCIAEGTVLAWVADLLQRCDVVFQNAAYDIGWMDQRPTRRFHDTHTMAVLIDENRHSYSLDSICSWLGIAGKDEALLREAVITHGGNPKRIKEHLWQLPARYVGPYAEQDAVATLEAAERMLPMLEGQNLWDAYHLETDLTPHVIQMRRRGVPIDVDTAERNQGRLRLLAQQELRRLKDAIGSRRELTIEDARSPRFLENMFTELGVAFPRTANTGQGSFEKEWLERCPHPAAQHVAQARRLHDGAEKFIGNYILGFLDRGRLHAEIHQLRNDDGGTRSYRISYSNPPLQQMNRAEPDKATEGHKDYVEGFVDVGTMIRECFVPERGEVYSAPDYSQQEYRLIVDLAAALGLPKSDEAVHYYQTSNDADYHNLVVKLTGLTRKRAKDCNFAKAFGAGIAKFALMTGMTEEEARETMRQYDEELPFVSAAAEKCKAKADKDGYIRLIDGRRCRFDEWEAAWIPKDEWEEGRREGHLMTPCDREEALRRQQVPGHPWRGKRLRRAGTHKAMNRRIQGSAAVMTKKAWLACAQAGHLPMLQMHDELTFSNATELQARQQAEIMESVVRLRVPVRVDNEHGPDWGRAKYDFGTALRMVRERTGA